MVLLNTLRVAAVFFIAGFLGSANLDDSNQKAAPHIQPLILTTYQNKETKCFDMNDKKLEYCLQPPDTPAFTPLRCYIDGELVFQCHTNETNECKAHSLLEGNVKHPILKYNCSFLQFFKVPPNLLNRHYVCCTPNGTFHLYLQPCTDQSSALPIRTEDQQLCGQQKWNTAEGVTAGGGTEDVNTTFSSTNVNVGMNKKIIIILTVVAVTLVAGFAFWIWKSLIRKRYDNTSR